SPRIHHQWLPDNVRYETGAMSDEVANALRAMGHKGLSGSGFGIGDANSIGIANGVLTGVSDPRNVGGVAGFYATQLSVQTKAADHLARRFRMLERFQRKRRFSRLSSPTFLTPINFMPRSISVRN